MKRRLFNSLPLISFLLAILIATGWGAGMISFARMRWTVEGDKTHRMTLGCIVDGRLIVLQRDAILVSHGSDMRTLTSERKPVPSSPHDWAPVPRIAVDISDVTAVRVEDYSVSPQRIAPEGFQVNATEKLTMSRIPWGRFGFNLGRERPLGRFTISGGWVSVIERVWAIPLWPLLVACMIPPARVIWCNRRSRRWSRTGRCSICGYDLRASTDRCPECGTEITGNASEARATA